MLRDFGSVKATDDCVREAATSKCRISLHGQQEVSISHSNSKPYRFGSATKAKYLLQKMSSSQYRKIPTVTKTILLHPLLAQSLSELIPTDQLLPKPFWP